MKPAYRQKSDLSTPLLTQIRKEPSKAKKDLVDSKGRKIYAGGTIGFEDEGFFKKSLFLHLNKIIQTGIKSPF